MLRFYVFCARAICSEKSCRIHKFWTLDSTTMCAKKHVIICRVAQGFVKR